MCWFSEAELNCVKTNIRFISELMQFEIGMSTKRYFPAIGTAGFERLSVNGANLEPCPPPRIMANMLLFIVMCFYFLFVLVWTKFGFFAPFSCLIGTKVTSIGTLFCLVLTLSFLVVPMLCFVEPKPCSIVPRLCLVWTKIVSIISF